MRTIQTTVYSFDELSEDAKQTAIDNNREINVDDSFWYESVYEDLLQFCKTIGIDVDLKKTYFSGFSHQGSGSSFTADVDIKQCLQAVKAEKWKEYAPNENISFYNVTDNMLRLSYLCSCDIVPTSRESSVKVNFDSDTYGKHTNIDAVITEIEDFFEDLASTINHWFYRNLEKEYEYQTEDEQVAETLRINEYEFLETGERS